MAKEDPTKSGEVDFIASKVYGAASNRNAPYRILFGVDDELNPVIEVRNAATGELIKSFGNIIKTLIANEDIGSIVKNALANQDIRSLVQNALYNNDVKGSIYKWGMFYNKNSAASCGVQTAGSEKFTVKRSSTGIYDISFAKSMGTTNYFVLGSAEGAGVGVETMGTYNQTATSVRVDWGYASSSGNYPIDPQYWNIAIVSGYNVF